LSGIALTTRAAGDIVAEGNYLLDERHGPMRSIFNDGTEIRYWCDDDRLVGYRHVL